MEKPETVAEEEAPAKEEECPGISVAAGEGRIDTTEEAPAAEEEKPAGEEEKPADTPVAVKKKAGRPRKDAKKK